MPDPSTITSYGPANDTLSPCCADTLSDESDTICDATVWRDLAAQAAFKKTAFHGL
jgi:hypothetical protein